jgi:hypothetical protein
VRFSSKDIPENIRRWMSPEDQALYAYPRLEAVPPMKTDKVERDEQRQFANYCLLHRYPFVWHGTHKRSTATVGCPDFIVVINGYVLFIEFKRDYSATLSAEQEEFGNALASHGHRLRVVYSCNEGIELLRRFEGVYVELSI